MARLDRRLVIGQNEQKIEFRFKATPTNNTRAEDLQASETVRMGMLKAFARAKQASAMADEAFHAVRLSDDGRTITGGGALTMQVLKDHFADPTQSGHIETIKKTFAAIRTGLHADVTISDLIEDIPGSEGLVNPRRAVGGPELMTNTVRDGLTKGKKDLEADSSLDTRYLDTFAKGRIQHELLVQLGPGKTRSIHVAFRFCRTNSVDYVARVIVHEASHKFGATGDVAYSFDKAFRNMSPALAAINADSYAFAAVSILRNRIVTDADLRDEPAAIRDASGLPQSLVVNGFQPIPGRTARSRFLGFFGW